MEELKAYIKADMGRVAALVEKSLGTDIPLLEKCNRHILEHKGKMVRPMITLLMADAIGSINDNTINFAAAAELIHNASLLHDDVADNSDSRRGVPTISSILGPRPSVLLGDFWLVKGIARILDATENSSRVMNLFGKTLSELAEGEMLQLEMAKGGATTEKEYYRIIYDKTATLFETSALAGAISAGATPEQEAAAGEFASSLGIAFQIKDDILDYEGDETLGKPLGQDLLEKKITLPLLGAMKACPSQEQKIREMVKGIEPGSEAQKTISSFVVENGGIDYAEEAMNAYLAKGIKALDAFPKGKAKFYLSMLAAYVGNRNK